MSDDLIALEQWAGGLLAALEPRERNALARRVAQDLRRSQQKRIAAQLNPDGTAFEPRKPRKFRVKKGRVKMLAKLRTARYLKARGDASQASVEFAGRVARIARVHQYGLRDRAEPGAPEVRYPERQPLGFTAEDIERVRDSLLAHLNV
ncbi:phage virion morphogenesis protein [Pseudomonas sp. RIT-PI-AD]|uniref:phage virion morphogenesis protein n=1 Tax=Pseudomonas sp. RIT-PI-AD TaxID=3035294 RepID=UPI0021D9A2DC|nr:phage virion morphogenesis protein [Pseudomonas sp. RIT-PI-AD]